MSRWRCTYQTQARKMLNKMVAQLTPLMSPKAMMIMGKATTQKMYLAKKIWYVKAEPRWSDVGMTE
jgi:hypothetical protein